MPDITTWVQENQLIALVIAAVAVFFLYQANKRWKQKRANKLTKKTAEQTTSRIAAVLDEPAPDHPSKTVQDPNPIPTPPPIQSYQDFEIEDDRIFLQKEVNRLIPLRDRLEEERYKIKNQLSELQSKQNQLETKYSKVQKRIKHYQDQLLQEVPKNYHSDSLY